MRYLQLPIFILLLSSLFACGNRPLAPVGTLEGDTPQSSRQPTPEKNQTSKPTRQATLPTIRGGYRVQPDDTLYSISWRYKQDYKVLAAYNGIKPPYTIHVGQQLRIPNQSASPNNPQKAPTPQADRMGPPQTHIIWRWPTQGKIIEFYSNKEPGNKGIDIAGKLSQAVYAAASGKVVYGGSGLPRYGNLLIIKHDDVYLSAYAHNQTLLVKEGQQVVAGQKIALLGKTGTQQHKLHFEIRHDGRPINPLPLLPKR